jgi:hypothetical protein
MAEAAGFTPEDVGPKILSPLLDSARSGLSQELSPGLQTVLGLGSPDVDSIVDRNGKYNPTDVLEFGCVLNDIFIVSRRVETKSC